MNSTLGSVGYDQDFDTEYGVLERRQIKFTHPRCFDSKAAMLTTIQGGFSHVTTSPLAHAISDPLLFPPPLPVSPLSTSPFGSFRAVNMERSDTLCNLDGLRGLAAGPTAGMPRDSFQAVSGFLQEMEAQRSGPKLVPVRESFQVVSDVIQELEAGGGHGPGDKTPPLTVSGDELPPSMENGVSSLVRLSTVELCDQCLPDASGGSSSSSSATASSAVPGRSSTGVTGAMRRQGSDVSFIDAVMAPPCQVPRCPTAETLGSVRRRSLQSVTEDQQTTAAAGGQGRLSRSDTDETMSPPAVTLPRPETRLYRKTSGQFDFMRLALTNTGEESFSSSSTLPPRPSLNRLVPLGAPAGETRTEQPMEAESTSPAPPEVPVKLAISPSALRKLRERASRRKGTKQQQGDHKRKVGFSKLVKVNTCEQAELQKAGSSPSIEVEHGRERRRRQSRKETKDNRFLKTWSLRSGSKRSTDGIHKTESKSKTKSQPKVPPSTAKCRKMLREAITPARFLLETKLDWSRWQRGIMAAPEGKSWLPSAMGHSGFVDVDLFKSSPSCGRPTVYELAIQTPKGTKKNVVFSKVLDTARIKTTWEKGVLQGSGSHLSAQIDDVLRQGCTLYVRRAILHKRISFPAGERPLQLSDAIDLRNFLRASCDYAWVRRRGEDGRYLRRDCVHRGVTLSSSLLS